MVVDAGGYAGATGYEEQYVYDGTYGELTDAKRRIENEWFWVSQTYEVTARYLDARYGGAPIEASELERLSRAVSDLARRRDLSAATR